ncbi:hypothetical protein [Maricaulis sp.]|uniref:hypothetical protein n=1 Tax=Maricaulis sp. TaxID=1486257 RepID=UPI00261F163F|nr:hypothetical protein [Maricaulis sp.]
MRLVLVVLVALAAFLGPNFVRASWDEPVSAGQPRLVAAMFRSSWCSACRILEPRVEDVREAFGEAPIGWVRFNFTWGERGGLRDLAVEEGIAPLYDRMDGRTGFLVLMDRETGQVFEIVTMDYGREQIREALERWLIVVERLESVEHPAP